MATQPSLLPPTAQPEMTMDEFLAHPWPEDERWELIDGRPYMSPSPAPIHQSLLSQLDTIINMACPAQLMVLPECDVELRGRRHCFRPDLIVVNPLSALELRAGPYRGVPRLVVEILSPSTGHRDLGMKLHAYAAAGVCEYWIADPLAPELWLNVLAASGKYEAQARDAEGFQASPLLCVRLRVRVRDGLPRVERG